MVDRPEGTPVVSVVLPTYDRARTLERAVRSVLDQEFADLELVVVDDGSTDGTPALLERIDDPRLVVVRLGRNQGGNRARNCGIATARGEIVCFLDSDDAYLPGKVGAVVEHFRAHPSVDVLVDSFEKVRFRDGRVVRRKVRRNPDLVDRDDFRERVFDRRLFKATPALSVRRRALLAVGGFDETLRRRQDMDLLLRLAERHRCSSTGAVLWTKHWTDDAISSTRDTYVDATLDLCARHPDYAAVPRFRSGLARDLARHLGRLARGGRLSALAADTWKLGRHFGARDLGRLLRLGRRELRERREAAGQGARELADEQHREVAVGDQQRGRDLPERQLHLAPLPDHPLRRATELLPPERERTADPAEA
ncbi:MAG: glycosyltransferase family 2 protein [Planctomycetota bacterium JB042]